MKKIISLTIVTVMLLASLCSCNGKTPSDNDGNIDNNDNNYNQNKDDNNDDGNNGYINNHQDKNDALLTDEITNNNQHKNDTQLTEEQLSKVSEIVDTYKYFILNGKLDVHFPSCKGIALVDVDQDGIAEIVLRYSDEFVILRYFEDYVYKYSLSWRSNLHKGGTCFWSTHAGHENGTFRIQFEGKELVYVDETHVINYGTENSEYYINDVPVTAEAIRNVPMCNEDIEFCEFNKDNLETLITVYSLTSKSLMCKCNNSIDN